MPRSTEITSHDDVIDSRNVLDRIDELAEREAPRWEANALGVHVATYNGYELIVSMRDGDTFVATMDGDLLAEEGGIEGDTLIFNCLEDAQDAALEAAGFDMACSLDGDEADELEALREFASAADNCSDWIDGAIFVRETYFETYAQELAEDIGLTKSDIQWPYTCIDWERAASELRQDYTPYEFEGTTYWVRS